MKPKILDDWHWFLLCYDMVLFQPFQYMKIVLKNKNVISTPGGKF